MRFQTKLIVVYSVFVLTASIVLGIGYYDYSIRHYEKNEGKNLEVAADQLVVQVEESLKHMELTMDYILSNEEILTGIRILAKAGEETTINRYTEEAKVNIRKGITTDYINNNFYRVIVFNRSGSVISAYDTADKRVKQDADFANMPWLSIADKSKGKPIIVSGHEDTWGVKAIPQVFSLLKAVQGTNMGYLEVQKKVDELQNQLRVSKEEIEYIVSVNGDELLYSTIPNGSEQFVDMIKKEGDFVQNYTLKEKKEEVLVAKSQSEEYNICVIAFERSAILKRESAYIGNMTVMVAAVFFAISLIFVIILSHYLTRPFRQLKAVMEDTRLENLGHEIVVDSTNDEIKALSSSYRNVLERLRESIIREKRISLLHIQAQFDVLQSQVNPHFLYNVLNVISARGMGVGDDKICDMCASLASMLRYSTNTKTRYATVRDELKYLREYFYLLKARFEHKIEFSIQVETAVYNQFIPKMTLQQIVENSINHGFKNITEKMRVVIAGGFEGNTWHISVWDNGEGFTYDVLEQLEETLRETKRKILEEPDNMEAEIGGIGVVNTYARLLLLYNGNVHLDLKNTEEGALVTIRAAMCQEDIHV